MREKSEHRIDWVTRPKTSTLLAEKLRKDLFDQTWHHDLPGIRILMKHYGVSAPPVHETLAMLETEGWISPAIAGRNRKIIRQFSSSKTTEILLGRPEIDEMTWLTRVIYRSIKEAFEKMRIPFREVILTNHNHRDFTKKLREELSGHSHVSGVIGMDLRHDVIREGVGPTLPLLMVGTKLYDDPRCATVALRLREILPDAIHYLITKKVTQFTIISAGLTKPMYDSLLPIVKECREKHGLNFNQEIDFPWIGPGALIPALRIITRDQKARLLVTINEAMWVRTLWEIRHMDPSVDVIAMWPSTAFKAFENPPCLCQIKIKEFVKHILKWHAEVKLGRIPTFSKGVNVKAVWSR